MKKLAKIISCALALSLSSAVLAIQQLEGEEPLVCELPRNTPDGLFVTLDAHNMEIRKSVVDTLNTLQDLGTLSYHPLFDLVIEDWVGISIHVKSYEDLSWDDILNILDKLPLRTVECIPKAEYFPSITARN